MPFLTEKQKEEVVQLFKEDKLSFNKIADNYNVTGSSIGAFYKKVYGHSKYKAISPKEAEHRRIEIISDLKLGTYTLEEIAHKNKLSRQRVHELAKKIFPEGYKLRRSVNRLEKEIIHNTPRFKCPQCGKSVFIGAGQIKYCKDCAKYFKSHKEEKVSCINCNNLFYPMRSSVSKYCSIKCFHAYRKNNIKNIAKTI